MYTHKLTTFFPQNSIAQGWLKNSFGTPKNLPSQIKKDLIHTLILPMQTLPKQWSLPKKNNSALWHIQKLPGQKSKKPHPHPNINQNPSY